LVTLPARAFLYLIVPLSWAFAHRASRSVSLRGVPFRPAQ
jgi:hypothetical protein